MSVAFQELAYNSDGLEIDHEQNEHAVMWRVSMICRFVHVFINSSVSFYNSIFRAAKKINTIPPTIQCCRFGSFFVHIRTLTHTPIRWVRIKTTINGREIIVKTTTKVRRRTDRRLEIYLSFTIFMMTRTIQGNYSDTNIIVIIGVSHSLARTKNSEPNPNHYSTYDERTTLSYFFVILFCFFQFTFIFK